MKTMIATLTTLALLGASSQRVSAGDREWATAGKVLTGLIAGSVLVRAFEAPRVHYYQSPTYYVPQVVQVPPAPTVYVQTAPVAVQATPVVMQPTPVFVNPAPVVVQAAPVYYVQPAPVYYVQSAPVYMAGPPMVSFHFGVGRRHFIAPPVHRLYR